MQRNCAALLTGLFFLGLLAPTPATAFPLNEADLFHLRDYILSSINESRKEEERAPLQYNKGIEKVAQGHADDTAAHFDPTDVVTREETYLAHTSYDGRSLNARYRDKDVETGWAFAENVGYWTRAPFGNHRESSEFGAMLMHKGMMAEVPPNDSHRKNIVGEFTHMGAGFSLLSNSVDGVNTIFLVTNFSRYSEEDVERAFRKRKAQSANARSLLAASVIPEHEGPFVDVRPSDEFAVAIADMKDRGIIRGYDDRTFQSDRTVSRAEILKMLMDSIGFSPIGMEFSACFLDVFNQWFAPYACVSKRKGWVTGYEDGRFRPGQTVTRAEGITLAARILEFDGEGANQNSFYDAPKDAWFSAPLQALTERDLLPFEGSLFFPERGLKRGEVAEMLSRSIALLEKEQESEKDREALSGPNRRLSE